MEQEVQVGGRVNPNPIASSSAVLPYWVPRPTAESGLQNLVEG